MSPRTERRRPALRAAEVHVGGAGAARRASVPEVERPDRSVDRQEGGGRLEHAFETAGHERLREPGCTGYLWSAVASRERDRISRASQEIFMITGENSHGESRGAKRASVLTSVAKILLKQMDWLPQWLQFGMSWLIHRVASL